MSRHSVFKALSGLLLLFVLLEQHITASFFTYSLQSVKLKPCPNYFMVDRKNKNEGFDESREKNEERLQYQNIFHESDISRAASARKSARKKSYLSTNKMRSVQQDKNNKRNNNNNLEINLDLQQNNASNGSPSYIKSGESRVPNNEQGFLYETIFNFDNEVNVNLSDDAYSIDSFLRGEYGRKFADDANAPHPELKPSETIEAALRALRALDDPELSHGAAVLMRFCAPLSRNERWGCGFASNSRNGNVWKELLRGSLNPVMLARRLRSSPEFSALLDWKSLELTDDLSVTSPRSQLLGLDSTVSYVNAALLFGDGFEPCIIQFTMRKISGVWLIENAMISKNEWLV